MSGRNSSFEELLDGIKRVTGVVGQPANDNMGSRAILTLSAMSPPEIPSSHRDLITARIAQVRAAQTDPGEHAADAAATTQANQPPSARMQM